MDLKGNLQMPAWLSGKKHVSKWLIHAVSLFGLALVIGSAGLWLADWRKGSTASDAAAEADAA